MRKIPFAKAASISAALAITLSYQACYEGFSPIGTSFSSTGSGNNNGLPPSGPGGTPNAAITFGQPLLNNYRRIPVQIQFSEEVFDLNADDLLLTNAEVVSINPKADVIYAYEVVIEVLTFAPYSVALKTAAVVDADGKSNVNTIAGNATLPAPVPGKVATVGVESVGNIALSGNILATHEGENVGIYNVADPDNPVFISRLVRDPSFTNILGINFNNNTLVVVTARTIEAYDLTTLNDPKLAGTAQIPAQYTYRGFNNTQVIGNHLLLPSIVNDTVNGVSDSYLLSFNIANPQNIILAAAINVDSGPQATFSLPYASTIKGDYMYISEQSQGVLLVNIANPASPVKVANIATPGEVDNPSYQCTQNIHSSGDYLYVASCGHGLSVFNIANPAQPVFLRVVPLTGNNNYATNVVGFGDIAYVWGYSSQDTIEVFRSNAAATTRIGTLNVPQLFENGRPFQQIGANRMFFLSGDGPTIVNTTQPATPAIVKKWDRGIRLGTVRLFKDNRVVSVGYDAFRVIDVSNPNSPVVLSQATHQALGLPLGTVSVLDLQGNNLGIYIRPPTGSVGQPNMFAMLNIADNNAITLMGQYPYDTTVNFYNTFSGSVRQDTLFVGHTLQGAGTPSIHGIRFLQGQAPTLATIIAMPDTRAPNPSSTFCRSPQDIVVRGNIVSFVCNNLSFGEAFKPFSYVAHYDISNPATPVELNLTTFPDLAGPQPESINFADDVMYMALSNGEIRRYNFATPTNPTLIASGVLINPLVNRRSYAVYNNHLYTITRPAAGSCELKVSLATDLGQTNAPETLPVNCGDFEIRDSLLYQHTTPMSVYGFLRGFY